tara:strand:+ start:664 stop:894 length:231 start_codon:yes stop_codon:yes gene_type:complete
MVILTAKVVNKMIEVLFPKIYEKIFGQIEDLIKPLSKYVHEPNELDDKVDMLEKRLSTLEHKCNKCSSDNKKWYDK